MSTSWNQEAIERTKHIFATIVEDDFVKEMCTGTLPMEKFMWYTEQDKLYLDDYARSMALLSSRVPDIADTAQLMQFCESAAVAEQTLHEYFLARYPHSSGTLKKSPACELYTGFLAKHAAFSSAEVAAASVLPCFWIYEAVGHHFADQLHLVANHPYARWLEMYVSAEYHDEVQRAVEMVDRLAANTTPEVREKMFEVYAKGCVMELMFWQSAYKMEQWPASA